MTYYSEAECIEKPTIHVAFDEQQLKLSHGVCKLLHDLNTKALSNDMHEKCCICVTYGSHFYNAGQDVG